MVRIGFEETAYTVHEEAGTLEVCVRVFEPDDTQSLTVHVGISMIIATRVGTAGMFVLILFCDFHYSFSLTLQMRLTTLL